MAAVYWSNQGIQVRKCVIPKAEMIKYGISVWSNTNQWQNRCWWIRDDKWNWCHLFIWIWKSVCRAALVRSALRTVWAEVLGGCSSALVSMADLQTAADADRCHISSVTSGFTFALALHWIWLILKGLVRGDIEIHGQFFNCDVG